MVLLCGHLNQDVISVNCGWSGYNQRGQKETFFTGPAAAVLSNLLTLN